MNAEMAGAADQVRKTPFSTLLVANRGEIALRIMRTARRMGYRTVAIRSDADAGSRHAREADLAVSIGGAGYLDAGEVLAAAKAAGADAVHPGYGFLAESAAFAEACAAAGLVFIGPSADAIARMGDKAAAKRAMAAAGVPCIPGYDGEDQDQAQLATEAERIGFPLMIKALAGGGGRGIRLVETADAFALALQSARSEAASAFGDGRVLLEKAIDRPRHVEFQVFGDRHGNAVHLGERDCSVQRRHQKLIEEAPSPFVGHGLRSRMGAAAVAAVDAIGYEGAGTLEFLVDAAGDFYFMEMNTRLQVEHPVTEAITGLDLVELQLRVAAGEPLGLAQDDVRLCGHAIEVRLCAEDPARDFLPQAGEVALWRAPPGLRVDTALQDGAAVPPHYDSMIAKLVAHGATRDEARRRLIAGLERTVALGLPTNRAFLARALAHPAFAAGEATTGFIGEHAQALLAAPEPGMKEIALAVLLLRFGRAGAVPRLPHPLSPAFPFPMRLEIDRKVVEAELSLRRDGMFTVSVGGAIVTARLEAIAPGSLTCAVDGISERVFFTRAGDAVTIHRADREVVAEDLTYAPPKAGENAADGLVVASIGGRVAAVLAEAGEHVAAGRPLVTIEAMKMEHVHRAPVAGLLEEMTVRVGDQIAVGRRLARIAPAMQTEEEGR